MSRAFVCDDPTALAECRRMDASLKAWLEQFHIACAELGAEGGRADIAFDGSIRIIGLPRTDPAPEGWRWTPSRQCMRPVRSHAGDAARKWLLIWCGHESAQWWMTEKFGMARKSNSPRSASGGRTWSWPDVTDVGDRLLVLYRYDDLDDFDANLWREIKLSEYHAALEAVPAEAGA